MSVVGSAGVSEIGLFLIGVTGFDPLHPHEPAPPQPDQPQLDEPQPQLFLTIIVTVAVLQFVGLVFSQI